ncbi:unnamed protein product [Amoebophrya sp. A25]|nr:unnamed protein product [Amoebophrya sp. A25]|eukprot:GSA25T00002514001.1
MLRMQPSAPTRTLAMMPRPRDIITKQPWLVSWLLVSLCAFSASATSHIEDGQQDDEDMNILQPPGGDQEHASVLDDETQSIAGAVRARTGADSMIIDQQGDEDLGLGGISHAMAESVAPAGRLIKGPDVVKDLRVLQHIMDGGDQQMVEGTTIVNETSQMNVEQQEQSFALPIPGRAFHIALRQLSKGHTKTREDRNRCLEQIRHTGGKAYLDEDFCPKWVRKYPLIMLEFARAGNRHMSYRSVPGDIQKKWENTLFAIRDWSRDALDFGRPPGGGAQHTGGLNEQGNAATASTTGSASSVLGGAATSTTPATSTTSSSASSSSRQQVLYGLDPLLFLQAVRANSDVLLGAGRGDDSKKLPWLPTAEDSLLLSQGSPRMVNGIGGSSDHRRGGVGTSHVGGAQWDITTTTATGAGSSGGGSATVASSGGAASASSSHQQRLQLQGARTVIQMLQSRGNTSNATAGASSGLPLPFAPMPNATTANSGAPAAPATSQQMPFEDRDLLMQPAEQAEEAHDDAHPSEAYPSTSALSVVEQPTAVEQPTLRSGTGSGTAVEQPTAGAEADVVPSSIHPVLGQAPANIVTTVTADTTVGPRFNLFDFGTDPTDRNVRAAIAEGKTPGGLVVLSPTLGASDVSTPTPKLAGAAAPALSARSPNRDARRRDLAQGQPGHSLRPRPKIAQLFPPPASSSSTTEEVEGASAGPVGTSGSAADLGLQITTAIAPNVVPPASTTTASTGTTTLPADVLPQPSTGDNTVADQEGSTLAAPPLTALAHVPSTSTTSVSTHTTLVPASRAPRIDEIDHEIEDETPQDEMRGRTTPPRMDSFASSGPRIGYEISNREQTETLKDDADYTAGVHLRNATNHLGQWIREHFAGCMVNVGTTTSTCSPGSSGDEIVADERSGAMRSLEDEEVDAMRGSGGGLGSERAVAEDGATTMIDAKRHFHMMQITSSLKLIACPTLSEQPITQLPPHMSLPVPLPMSMFEDREDSVFGQNTQHHSTTTDSSVFRPADRVPINRDHTTGTTGEVQTDHPMGSCGNDQSDDGSCGSSGSNVSAAGRALGALSLNAGAEGEQLQAARPAAGAASSPTVGPQMTQEVEPHLNDVAQRGGIMTTRGTTTAWRDSSSKEAHIMTPQLYEAAREKELERTSRAAFNVKEVTVLRRAREALNNADNEDPLLYIRNGGASGATASRTAAGIVGVSTSSRGAAGGASSSRSTTTRHQTSTTERSEVIRPMRGRSRREVSTANASATTADNVQNDQDTRPPASGTTGDEDHPPRRLFSWSGSRFSLSPLSFSPETEDEESQWWEDHVHTQLPIKKSKDAFLPPPMLHPDMLAAALRQDMGRVLAALPAAARGIKIDFQQELQAIIRLQEWREIVENRDLPLIRGMLRYLRQAIRYVGAKLLAQRVEPWLRQKEVLQRIVEESSKKPWSGSAVPGSLNSDDVVMQRSVSEQDQAVHQGKDAGLKKEQPSGEPKRPASPRPRVTPEDAQQMVRNEAAKIGADLAQNTLYPFAPRVAGSLEGLVIVPEKNQDFMPFSWSATGGSTTTKQDTRFPPYFGTLMYLNKPSSAAKNSRPLELVSQQM